MSLLVNMDPHRQDLVALARPFAKHQHTIPILLRFIKVCVSYNGIPARKID